jgi:hypothetical protein
LKVMVFVLNGAVLGLMTHMHPCYCSEMYKRYALKIFVHMYMQSLGILAWSLGDWQTYFCLSRCNSGNSGRMNIDVKVNTEYYLPNFWTFLDLGNWKIQVEKQCR